MKVRALIVFIMVLAMVGSAWAVQCPSTDIKTVKQFNAGGGDFKPRSVAVSSSGKTYVTDDFADQVTVFDRAGKVVNYFEQNNPYGIAIDDNDNIYLGWANDNNAGYFKGQVDVYDSNFRYKGSLGSGFGEFQLPYSIATDDTRVYVVDNRADSVKIYDRETYEYIKSFGGSGTSNGNLARPTGIVVHSPGILFVSDNALFMDSNFATGYGAGVHKFSIDSNNNVQFVTRFVNYGHPYEETTPQDAAGYMGSPGGIAVDASGRVFVTDTLKGDIEVFDVNGGSICTYPLASYTLFPRGMASSGESKMLVTAHGKVFVLGIGQYTDMVVSPTSLQFDAQVCGAQSGSDTVTISNNGDGALSWTASSNAGWLTISPSAGTVNGGASASMAVDFDASSLSAGWYTGVITVSSEGATEYVVASLQVTGAPAISAAPLSFDFTVVGNDVPAAQSMNVEMTGGNGWTATVPSWISMTPSQAQGSTMTLASVGINATALDTMEGGSYSDTITIDTGCSAVPLINADVALTYIKGGTIDVTTNLDSASFTISGPETYTGTGTSFSVSGAPEGEYTVTFDTIAGFKTPESSTATVANGETTSFEGNYKDLRAQNSLIVSEAVASVNGENTVNVYQADGILSGTFNVELVGDNSSSRGPGSVASGSNKSDMLTASGDVDGDGIDEIIVSLDNGKIVGYEADGSLMPGLELVAFIHSVDADVAAADLDGDGVDELIVGTGTGSVVDSAVRVFSYSGAAVYDTGIYFLASDGRDGVRVAAGDVDGDDLDEIITLTMDNINKTAMVRIWDTDTGAGAGSWNVTDGGGFTMAFDNSDMAIASGDVDGNGTAEIVLATNAGNGAYTVTIYNAAGAAAGSFAVTDMNGINIAAGDTDYDGTAEIVAVSTGDFDPSVSVYSAAGALITQFQAFEGVKIKGARVSLGQVVAR